jgi:hypothetical protein
VLRVPRSGLTVNGDITRLSRVVQNLLTNAWRPRREYTKCSTRRDVPHVPYDSTPHVTVLDCTGSDTCQDRLHWPTDSRSRGKSCNGCLQIVGARESRRVER